MKTRYLFCTALFLAGCLPAYAQSSAPLSPAQAQAAFQAEQALIEQARYAAGRDDPAVVDGILASQDGLANQVHPSVLLGRRAAGACAWLRNDGERAAAMRVAERALAVMATMREERDADRAERLYWEAVLRGDFLDQKEAALALLQEADRLAPDDDRILEGALQLAEALAEFGR